MLEADGWAGRRSWEWEGESGAPSDGCRGGHMWCRKVAASFSRCLRGGHGHVSTMTSISANRSGILMRGSLVGKIPSEPNAEASTLEGCHQSGPHIKKRFE